MAPVVLQTLRSRGFAAAVHAGLWLLLYLGAIGFGAKAPLFRDSVALPLAAQSPAPVAKLDKLFSPGIWPKISVDTNVTTAFFTRHFIPPATPAPPAPTTRKVEITYLGYYESAGSPKHVIVKLADAFVVKPLGANLTTNWFVAEGTMQALILTNITAQHTVLPLNAKKEVEVPIQ